MAALVAVLTVPFAFSAQAEPCFDFGPECTFLEGTTDGGAFIKIAVPAAWNGDLVVYNHGFSLDPIGPGPELGPLFDLMVSQGYAVAASSYQQIGWALYKTKNDLQNMVNVFTANFGTPAQVFVHGFSLGGIVTAQAVEKANLGNVVGAYPACGALAGSRSWDAAIDLRLLYDVICGDVPGAAIPGGPTGLPARFTEYPFSDLNFALALNACFGGLFGPPSPEQLARLRAFLDETDLPVNFVTTDMGFAVFALSDLIFDPTKLDGKQGVGNVGVTYDDPAIDAAIQRVAAQPGGANRHRKNYTPSGNVGDVKIVSIHTDGDGLVIVEQEQPYRDAVPAANLTIGIVDEVGNTHCGFTGAELTAGWESLRAWVAGAPQPSPADLQATCNDLAPSFGGPCRIDPDYVIPNMDGRSPPR